MRRRLAGAGVGVGDRVGVRIPSGTADLYVAILGRPRRRRRLRAGRRRRPRRARRAGLRRGRGVRRARRPDLTGDRAARRPGTPRHARPRRRRLDHLHLRLHRHAQGRRGHATARAAAFVDAEAAAVPRRTSRSAPATGCWPGSRSPSTPPARRCGWPGGTAPAWCPRRARWCAAASTSARGWSAQRITVVSTVPTLAALWPPRRARRRAAADLRRRGVPARAGRAARRRGPRGVEHLRPDRGHRRRLRRAADRRGTGADRAAAGRLGAGRRRRRGRAGRDGRERRAGHRRRRAGPLPRPRQGRREVRPAAVARLGARLPQRRPRARRRRRAWSSSAAPTSRSSSAAGGSSSARSTPRCRRCPASAPRRPPCAAPAAGNQLLVGYVVPDDGWTPTPLRSPCAPTCPPRSCRCSRSSTTCRPAPRARSTATRCPGRSRRPAVPMSGTPPRRVC